METIAKHLNGKKQLNIFEIYSVKVFAGISKIVKKPKALLIGEQGGKRPERSLTFKDNLSGSGLLRVERQSSPSRPLD